MNNKIYLNFKIARNNKYGCISLFFIKTVHSRLIRLYEKCKILKRYKNSQKAGMFLHQKMTLDHTLLKVRNKENFILNFIIPIKTINPKLHIRKMIGIMIIIKIEKLNMCLNLLMEKIN
jgi:hypothetical protein